MLVVAAGRFHEGLDAFRANTDVNKGDVHGGLSPQSGRRTAGRRAEILSVGPGWRQAARSCTNPGSRRLHIGVRASMVFNGFFAATASHEGASHEGRRLRLPASGPRHRPAAGDAARRRAPARGRRGPGGSDGAGSSRAAAARRRHGVQRYPGDSRPACGDGAAKRGSRPRCTRRWRRAAGARSPGPGSG